jgi:hypothetical protein
MSSPRPFPQCLCVTHPVTLRQIHPPHGVPVSNIYGTVVQFSTKSIFLVLRISQLKNSYISGTTYQSTISIHLRFSGKTTEPHVHSSRVNYWISLVFLHFWYEIKVKFHISGDTLRSEKKNNRNSRHVNYWRGLVFVDGG